MHELATYFELLDEEPITFSFIFEAKRQILRSAGDLTEAVAADIVAELRTRGSSVDDFALRQYVADYLVVNVKEHRRQFEASRSGADYGIVIEAPKVQETYPGYDIENVFNGILMAVSRVRWKFQTQRLRRLYVDDELEFRRLFYGKIGGLGAFENLVDVRRGASHEDVEVRPVAHETTRACPRPPTSHKRDSLVAGKLHDAGTVGVHEPRGHHYDSLSTLPRGSLERPVETSGTPYLKRLDVDTQPTRGRLCVAILAVGMIGGPEHRDARE